MGICMSKHSKIIAEENEILKNKLYLYANEVSTLRLEMSQMYDEKYNINEKSNQKIQEYRASIQKLQTQLSFR
jgi:hypothetical protein